MKFPVKVFVINKFKLTGLLLLLFIFPILSQEDSNGNDSLFHDLQIFESNKPLNWSLTFDIRKFRKEKFDNEKLPAILTLHNRNGIIQKNIHLKARGVSRKEICYFPPIKLKLKDVFLYDPYLSQVKNQKLVTHCNMSKSYTQTILREYLIYKLFNLITDKSFKVQLVDMNYIDSEDNVKPFKRFAFLIEDVDVLSNRNNSFVVKSQNLRMKHVNKSSMIQLSLFQYMIGNVDWSITAQHNVKLLRVNELGEDLPYAIPYDFDYAGFVNATYAINVQNPEISSVKTRMFVGVCYTKKEYKEIAKRFSEKKNEITSLINNFELLEPKTKKRISNYISDFYELLEQPDFYEEYVLPVCKNINTDALTTD